MKTQSPDTSPDAERALIAMIQKAPVSKRFAFVQAWTVSMLEAGSQSIRQLHPQVSNEEARLLFMERQYGTELITEACRAGHVHRLPVAESPDYRRAVLPVVKRCSDLGIPCALSGSLACSLYGLQRATLHIDLIVDLHQKHLLALCDHLDHHYLLREEEIETAVQQQTCFTLVHLESLLKVQITLPGRLITGQQVFQGVREVTLVEGEQAVPVLAPEPLIVLLLDAFKSSHERADDLWYDLLGVVKVQGTNLDVPLLTKQAGAAGVQELLARAFVDAGLTDA